MSSHGRSMRSSTTTGLPCAACSKNCPSLPILGVRGETTSRTGVPATRAIEAARIANDGSIHSAGSPTSASANSCVAIPSSRRTRARRSSAHLVATGSASGVAASGMDPSTAARARGPWASAPAPTAMTGRSRKRPDERPTERIATSGARPSSRRRAAKACGPSTSTLSPGCDARTIRSSVQSDDSSKLTTCSAGARPPDITASGRPGSRRGRCGRARRRAVRRRRRCAWPARPRPGCGPRACAARWCRSRGWSR